MRTRTTRSKGRPLADPELNTRLLEEQLRSLGLYAAHTLGDGNCLFRALSDQFYGTPARHLQLRKDICDWIESHRQRYEPFCEDERGLSVHLQCMRQQGTYGGHLELSAFAHYARRHVKVIQPGLVYVIEWNAGGDEIEASASPSTRGCPDQMDDVEMDPREKRRLRRQQRREVLFDEAMLEESPGDTVYVAYHDWEHFSSVRNLRGPHTGLAHVVEVPPDQAEPLPSAPSTPVKKKPSSRAKSKPESKAGPKSAKADANATAKMDQDLPPSPAHIPLPESRSPSPDSSESLTQSDPPSIPIIPVAVQLVPTTPLRIHRSPKRTIDESSGSSLSDIVAKRTRNSRKSFSKVDTDQDAIEVDDPEESTPELSAPCSSNESSPLSSAASSPAPTTPPAMTPPPEPRRPMTRRQRKALGLPKPKTALLAKKTSAGRIVVPGGRYKRGAAKPVSVREAGDDNGDEDEGSLQDGEWRRNGTGRLDVRGFRELKI